METYLIFNLLFLGIAFGVLALLKSLRVSKLILAVLAVLLVLTAIFDSFIILADIVAYDHDKLLGIYIGAAPIEDFFYSILVAVMIPAVWHLTKRKEHNAET